MDEQGGIPEEDEGDDTDEGTPRTQHRSSLDYTRPKLTDVDEGISSLALNMTVSIFL
jgi:hypothetical protein